MLTDNWSQNIPHQIYIQAKRSASHPSTPSFYVHYTTHLCKHQ